MASIASSCRLSARVAARSVRRNAQTRAFRTSRNALAAQNFSMPALSPTMTEGNIAKWLVKEGDSFSAGDVLLQVETDKAQMDVEAPDDGVLAKITQGDGSSAVKVGSRIAVIADPGDDVSALEIPPEDTASSSSSQPKEESKPSSSSAPPEPKSNSAAPSTSSHTKSESWLYPSVAVLLHQNNLSPSDIQASGPDGRILKGDVLAHLGQISSSAPESIASHLSKLSHLDLTNITKAAPPSKPSEAQAPKKEAESEPEPELYELSIPISLAPALKLQQRLENAVGAAPSLGVLVARAIAIANEDLPRRRGAPSQAELFNSVIGYPSAPKISYGDFEPVIGSLAPPPAAVTLAASKKRDILDEIIGGKKRSASRLRKDAAAVAELKSAGAENVFSLVVDKADEKRAYVFLEKMKTVLEAEPGRLVF